jgi:F-type H+-transporting ATPase subunit a
MKQIKSLLLLLVLALMPTFAFAEEAGHDGKSLDIPTTVLEHLSDSYEWHIASSFWARPMNTALNKVKT